MIAVYAVVIAGLSMLFLSPRTPPDPVVNGRTLSCWLMTPDYEEYRFQWSQAVLESGKEGIPLLRSWLRSGNRLERTIIRNAPASFWNRWPLKQWRKQFVFKEKALSALKILGDSGLDATGDLLSVIQDSTENSDLRAQAMQTLFSVGADINVVVPALEKLVSDPVMGRTASRCLKDFQTGKFWADRPVQMPDFGDLQRRPVPTRTPNENLKLANLRREAEAGDSEAQAWLATFLHEGKPSFPKQEDEAYKWATIAASRENTRAKHLLRELELFLDPKDITAGKAAADAFISGSKTKAQ